MVIIVYKSGELEHAVDGTEGFFGEIGADMHLRLAVAQAVAELGEGIELHVCAVVAGA